MRTYHAGGRFGDFRLRYRTHLVHPTREAVRDRVKRHIGDLMSLLVVVIGDIPTHRCNFACSDDNTGNLDEAMLADGGGVQGGRSRVR